MKRSMALRLLLHVYPRVFRARFEAEVEAYLAFRREELAPRGRLAVAWSTAGAVGDVLRTGLAERARELAWRRTPLASVPFLLAGAVSGALVLTCAFVVFEQVVRQPLTAMQHASSAGPSVLLFPAAMLLVIVGLCVALRKCRTVWQDSPR